MTEKQIADFIEAEYYKEGATGLSFDTIVCFGANAADQHHSPSETRTLKAGECVLIDYGMHLERLLLRYDKNFLLQECR